MIERKSVIRWASFAAYFAAIFFTFLLLLFPFDRIKTRIESDVRSNTPVELSISRISPRFFNRFVLDDVVVSDKSGKVLFESRSVSAKLSLFGLLRRLISLDLNASAYGGELLIKTRQGAGQKFIMVDADGLEIGSYPALKDFGLQLSGKAGGNMELSGDAGKGRLWFKGLAWRGLKIKGFPIPDMDFDQGWFEAELKNDRLTVKKLEVEGKELKIRITGDMVLRERGTLNLVIKLKPSERLAHEQAGILALLKNKDAEGFHQFTLGGTLAEPMPRL